MKIKKISDVLVYPRSVNTDDTDTYDWYDFTGGFDIDSDSVNAWIQDLLDGMREELIRGVQKASSYVRSGNTMVTLFAYRQETGLYTLSYTVAKSYMSSEIDDYDPLEEFEFFEIKKD